MTTTLNLLGLSGSLRERSTNTALLRAAASLAPDGVSLDLYDYTDVPLYNGDLDRDGERPEPVERLKAAIAAADGLLVATPEYNHGVPGVLKNAIDWASRPAYRSPFVGKPVAILGAATSFVGTARAQEQLRDVMFGMLAEVFPYREFLVGGAPSRFDADLELTDDPTRARLVRLLDAYTGWIRRRAG